MSLILMSRTRGAVASSSDPDFPNRPEGYTTFRDLIWTDTLYPTGWGNGGLSPDYASLVDYSGPYGPKSMQVRYPVGTSSAQRSIMGTVPDIPRGDVNGMYAVKVFRFSDDFVQHPTNVKIQYPIMYEGGFRPFSMTTEPVTSTSSGQFTLSVGMNVVDDPGYPTRYSNITDRVLTNGVWYRLETLCEYNSNGGSDGVLRWWTSSWNGSSWDSPVLMGDHTNVKLNEADTPPRSWGGWDFQEYFGGSGTAPVPVEQYTWTNRLYVATAP